MILLWGVPGDSPLDAVYSSLQRSAADVCLLDQRFASEMSADLQIESQGYIHGRLAHPKGEIDFAAVRAAYIRPMETGKLRHDTSDTSSPVRAAEVDCALIAWADISHAHVVNRPFAMAANNSKPYQLQLIAKCGFRVPDTLVSTDEAAVRRFLERHRKVIFKSVSGIRSIVSSINSGEFDFTDVANCPTQFQEYIPGVDVRVHVAGESTIATLIRSGVDDYRYASRSGAEVAMEPLQLPADVDEACRRMVRGMGLYLGGIDLRLTPDGRWYCLEVNPSPGFTYFEGVTGQPIAAAVANLLERLDASPQ
jgi:glutathione synthase/RimK-type ligase-like ATP-grasp enzyme